MSAKFETIHAVWTIDDQGTLQGLLDKATGENVAAKKKIAYVKQGEKEYPVTGFKRTGDTLFLVFSGAGTSATLAVEEHEEFITLEVLSFDYEGSDSLGDEPKKEKIKEKVDEFIFADYQVSLGAMPNTTVEKENETEKFAGCALALNLTTNVKALPKPTDHLKAVCHARFGFVGAKVALIASPLGKMRNILKQATDSAPDVPSSPIGGARALDGPLNQGSYLLNFGDLSLDVVDDWIELAQSIGFTQIDFHGGNSFRFGDCHPNPDTYPDGLDSLKAVVDKLHDAGIAAGLHTYAFFIDKKCPWVTPVPNPGLGKLATFTLAEDLNAEGTYLSVLESTEETSNITGFFVRNSVTLQIDDELIIFKNTQKGKPFGFTDCERGALGTKATEHSKGVDVHHLKECFGLFAPDPDTPLFTDVAAATANAFNHCGFDMMYLDALDGEDLLGGRENSWHYGSRFVFELWNRLDHPALMEMSTFHHHLWYVRARMGAWDRPNRSYKKFIDIHNEANEQYRNMFLPAHLGWWGINTWAGHEVEPTMTDDVEYLCTKAIATDTGFSLMGIDPQKVKEEPHLVRLSEIIKRYEAVRHAKTTPEHIKTQLKKPGKEFRLVDGSSSRFCPVENSKYKIEALLNEPYTWNVSNRFHTQEARLRIEVLYSAADYDSSEAILITDFSDVTAFSDRSCAEGVSAKLTTSTQEVIAGSNSGHFVASNSAKNEEKTADVHLLTEHGQRLLQQKNGSWAKVGMVSDPPLDLCGHEAFGFWLHGDGQGEVLNLQLKNPSHMVGGVGDHYIIVDFTGWEYFELIEPEAERVDNYIWPYGANTYAIYREGISYDSIEELSLWYNNIPANGSVRCFLSPIKALPLVEGRLTHPTLSVGDRSITFPVDIETGQYLEYGGGDDCVLYGNMGEVIAEVAPQGDTIILEPGENEISLNCPSPGSIRRRAKVTVITEGKELE